MIGLGEGHTTLRAIISILISSLLEKAIAVPFSLYSNFVVEARHGFNKMTLLIFVMDLVKSSLIEVVILIPMISAILWILAAVGSLYWLYIFVFILTVQIIMQVVYPTLIAPLFNTYTPLEEGKLKEDIEALCKRVKFPLSKVFVVDGSMRSGHSNAMLYGLFRTKRIWLYDTLIEKIGSDDGICAVIAHELGHWMNWDIWKTFAIGNAYLITVLYFFYLFNTAKVVQNFGFADYDVYLALIIYFSHVLPPVETVFALAMNFYLRKVEFDADAFAKELGQDLTLPLIQLHKSNLSTMIHDRWYSLYHNSHPTLLERLERLGYRPETNETKDKTA